MTMNLYMLHEIRVMCYTAVEYIKGEGAFCPVCARFGLGQHRLLVTSTAGDGLRYATCSNCKFTFKTVEKVCAIETPETLDPDATVIHCKGRKRRKK
jgi:formate dehydrogenase maturation protein FdhE